MYVTLLFYVNTESIIRKTLKIRIKTIILCDLVYIYFQNFALSDRMARKTKLSCWLNYSRCYKANSSISHHLIHQILQDCCSLHLYLISSINPINRCDCRMVNIFKNLLAIAVVVNVIWEFNLDWIKCKLRDKVKK